MSMQQTALVVGGTGRTGGRVLEQLLRRGVAVRAIVRSADRLPSGLADDPGLTVVEADLLSLDVAGLAMHVRGCDAVVSCLGHVATPRGIFGAPRDLVADASRLLCQAIRESHPHDPIRFVLMSSVSVNHPAGLDTRRGALERRALRALCGVLPPARDNQRAADFLHDDVGADSPFVQWVAVRPDTLREGDVSDYELHPTLVSSIFRPDSTNMANVAHFMCELVTDAETWDNWRGKLPVIINAPSAGA